MRGKRDVTNDYRPMHARHFFSSYLFPRFRDLLTNPSFEYMTEHFLMHSIPLAWGQTPTTKTFMW